MKRYKSNNVNFTLRQITSKVLNEISPDMRKFELKQYKMILKDY